MNPQKKTAASPQVELYEKLLQTIPEIERKGNMFTLLLQSKSLAIRLPKAEREGFLKKHKTRLFEAYGAVMPEYVAVPDSLLKNTKELQKYLQISYDYAKTLKPKATKKKS